MAGQAVFAVAAEDREAGDHVVAGLHVAHLGAHRLDDPGALVAHHDRRGDGVLALHEVQVAVAEPGGGRANEDLIGAGGVDGDLLEGQLSGDGMEDGSAHGQSFAHCNTASSLPRRWPRSRISLGPTNPVRRASCW